MKKEEKEMKIQLRRKREDEKEQQKKGKHTMQAIAHRRIRERSSDSHIPDGYSTSSTSTDMWILFQ